MLQGMGILELAHGGRIEVAFCPLTGDPIVDGRDLPEGTMVGFSAADPPRGAKTDSNEKRRRAISA